LPLLHLVEHKKIPEARSVVSIIINAGPLIHLRSRDNIIIVTHDQPSELNAKEHNKKLI